MDYTLSPNNVVDAGTGFRRHEDNQALPTVVSEKDMNDLIWNLMEITKAAGVAGVQFDEAVPASYQAVVKAVKRLCGANVTTVNFAVSPFALTTDHAGLVLVDCTGGNVVLNLPAANLVTALPIEYVTVKTDASANTATFNRAVANNIDDGTSFVLAAQFQNRTIRSNAVDRWLTIAAAGQQLVSGRNLLINGNFNINQRVYVSGAATVVANQYTLDRWRVVTSGQNLAFAASGNGNQVTAPAGGIEQVILGGSIGDTAYVVNWVGTATCTVDGVAKTKGAAVTLVPGTNATVKFTGGTVSQAQLERGSAVTSFDHRPASVELALCQHYWNRITLAAGFYYAAASGIVLSSYAIYPPMRVAPTVTSSMVLSGFAANWSTGSITTSGFLHGVDATTVGYCFANGTVTLNAEV